MVNWFRKDREGRFLWPGYGENIRVLKWIVDRVHGHAAAERTAVGMMPAEGELDLTGLEIASESLKEAMAVKPQDWAVELDSQEEFFKKIGDTVPAQDGRATRRPESGFENSVDSLATRRKAPPQSFGETPCRQPAERTRMLAVEAHRERLAFAA